jgi:hypothetical protein
MDSTNWSEEQKANAGVRFTNRLKQWLAKEDIKAEALRNKVAIDSNIPVTDKVSKDEITKLTEKMMKGEE